MAPIQDSHAPAVALAFVACVLSTQRYTGPFQVDPQQVPLVLAKAMDRAGNEENLLQNGAMVAMRSSTRPVPTLFNTIAGNNIHNPGTATMPKPEGPGCRG